MKRYSLYIIIFLFIACKKDAPPPEPPVIPLITNADFVLNPTGKAPLSAQLNLSANKEVKVKIFVDGAIPVEHAFAEFAMEHQLPILGLYPNVENKIYIESEDIEGNIERDTLNIPTTALPSFLPEVRINEKRVESMEAGMTFCNIMLGRGNYKFYSKPIIFDSNGDIRWYMELGGDLIFPIIKLRNGNLMFALGSSLIEYDMLGNEMTRYVLNDYYQHHEIYEKEDGK
ncbi:MAG: aryl-sulfate sulfotransferase, partial [Bacteroidota bacterium]